MPDTLSYTFTITDEVAMLSQGQTLAPLLKKGCVVYLHGEMGTGKTTLVRGVLKGLGYGGQVKSPTYTLVEPYNVDDITVFHFDLYRLGNAEELEYLGVRDYFSGDTLILIEWPEKGWPVLPEADIDIFLEYIPQGRRMQMRANSVKAQNCLQLLDT